MHCMTLTICQEVVNEFVRIQRDDPHADIYIVSCRGESGK